MYCTASDVRKVIHTSLTDSEIEGIITTSDAQITMKTGSRITGELARKLSTLLSASHIKTRQPDSTAIGEYRESTENIQEVWGREIDSIYRLHSKPAISSRSYSSLEESDRYKEGDT